MSQEVKAIARSAQLMAGSARVMQDVAEHISGVLEQQNILFEGLIQTLQKDKGGKTGSFGSGLGELGGGVKQLAGGLGELAKILPDLVKGLSGFKSTKGADRFLNFVFRLQEAIGKNTKSFTKEIFVPWTEFSKAMDSMANGLATMSLGLLAFSVLTTEKGNDRFISFISKLSENFTEIDDGEKMKSGAEALGTMAESIFLLGLSLAVSSVFYAVGAIGSLIIVPMIYGYSLLFGYLEEKSDDIEKGAKATTIMGLGILSMSLGIYAAKQLADGDWADYAKGSLIVLLSMAVFGAAFYFAGKFSKEIKKGSVAFIASGLGIASLALGIAVMQQVLPDITTVLIAGMAVFVIGGALALIGSAAAEIAFGALALIASGLGLASLAMGLATFGYFKITWGEIAVAGASILGIGVTMAAVGVASPFIALGAVALILAGISMVVLAAGLTVFGLIYKKAQDGLLGQSNEEGKTNLDVVIGGIVKAFSISPIDSVSMGLGSVALMLASISMIFLSLGLAVLNTTYKTALNGLVAINDTDKTKNNMEVLLGGIVKAFSINAIDSALMAVGAIAFILAGAAMTVLSLGIFTLAKAYEHTGELFKKGDSNTKLEDMAISIKNSLMLGPIDAAKLAIGSVGFISAGLALVSIALGVSQFSKIVKDSDMGKINESITTILTAVVEGISGAYESTNWDNVKKGIDAVSNVGNLLSGIAEGVSKMAELKFPIYGDDGKITGYFGIDDSRFGQVAENIKLIITCIGDALSEVGASQGDTKWFSKSNAEKGADIIRGVGQDLVSLADFVLKVADLRIPMLDSATGKVLEGRFTVIQPADLAKGGRVRKNIINIISAISSAFAAVGSGASAQSGFFNKSDIENGKLAIMGVANDVAAMAKAAKDIAEIKDFDSVPSRIKTIVIAFPQAIIEAYNTVVANMKGTTLADMAAQLNSVANPVSAFIDVLAKYQDKKIQDKSGANLGSVISGVLASLNKPILPASITSLGEATDYIQKLASSADAIDKLSNAFSKMAKSIDVFANSFKKMDSEVLKNSDMLIESLVVFSKVDPKALDANTEKGKTLINFIYDKAKPIETPVASAPVSTPTAPKPIAEKGIKPVETTNSKNNNNQSQAALEDALAQLQTTMAQLVASMDAIKSVLTNPRGIKIQD